MKKAPLYLIIMVLLSSALLLAACGADGAVSAAENESAAIEETAGSIVDDDLQETPIDVESIDSSDDVTADADAVIPDSDGRWGNGSPGSGLGNPIAPAGELSQSEIEALLYMREEEKLARDVYLSMYELWGTPVFSNIAASEQAHFEAIGALLSAYGLDDPAQSSAAGVFTNPDLQALYDELVAQGQTSLQDALIAGAAIEEIDILDLQKNLAQVENTAVTQVFERLLAGSANHLRAYATNLERQAGILYAPQYMNQEAYNTLLGAAAAQGNGPGGRGPANGGGRGRAG